MKADRFTEIMESIAPISTQEEWDNSGWQLKLSEDFSKLLIAMEVTREVVEEAVAAGADLILTHHPLIFSGVKVIDVNDVTGNLIKGLIEKGISVYSTHTPFDIATGGNNDYLGKSLGFTHIRQMEGDFLNMCRMGEVTGEGVSLMELIDIAERALDVDSSFFSFSGDRDVVIKKAGWCTGSGSEFMELAINNGCQIFITGDVKYHSAQKAKELGINLLDLGHFATEKIFVDNVEAWLKDRLTNEKVEVIKSKVNLNPFSKI